MDNHGNSPDQEANKGLQSPKERRGAKGHSEPQGIMRSAELGQMGGGSSSLQSTPRSPKGHNEPLKVSAADMLSKQLETGNMEYPAEMMAEQRKNQKRNEMSRHRGGTTNPDDAANKTA